MNRKQAEEFILEFMKDIDPSMYNYEKYKNIFKDMDDKDFDEYMRKIRDKKASLVIFKPMYKANITVENNLKVADKYGIKLFERLKIINDNKMSYMTDIEYLILKLPYRRQSQNLVKKINIPKDNKVIDELTFQPTGDSKGAKISFPELQVLIGMGLENTIEELIKYRGGDKNGFMYYNTAFMKFGRVSLKSLSYFSSGVKSTKLLKIYLLGMHIKSSL